MSDVSPAVFVLILLVAVIPTVAVYIWTALGLSAVFGKIGQEQWRAWVPIVNQITLLMVAGMSGWLFLLVLVPVLGWIAFWVATIVAVHRINRGFGLGGGMTALAAVLFPVWASVVGFGVARWQRTDTVSAPVYARTRDVEASGGTLPPARAERYAAPAPEPHRSAAVASVEPDPWAQPAAGTAPAVPASAVPESAEGAAMDAAIADAAAIGDAAASAWAPPTSFPASAPAPALPGLHTAPVAVVASDAMPDDRFAPPPERPADGAGAVPWTPTGEPAAPAAQAFDERWASGFDEVSAISQPPQGDPIAARAVPTGLPPLAEDGSTGPERARSGGAVPATPPRVPTAPVTSLRTSPVDIDPSFPAVTRAPVGTPRTPAGPGPEFPLDTADEVSAVAGAPVAGAPRSALVAAAQTDPASSHEDFAEETVLTRRRRARWTLQPASGPGIDLTADVVILGRQPAGDPAYRGAQLVAVPDDTRTVSKTHARLELAGDRWRVTDLGSTNGVLLPTLMGTEVEADPGAELAPGERFLLGDAVFRLVRADA
ncbi:DUF5684 domain-containing protein [Microbacterium sp. zg.Y1090]|uniref:DUF5684 domain-containing protein n=1 Tax=Microbacterium TaxID=33882 RepID=UPI00214CD3FD|nr:MULTISPECIES: DUF5684 domain-containing protein [unclassified Microbacterium]MCR2813748.1 DUF5684 domain-containing protein [Microbacterium sp. zg.Y1084]MCR2819738.1 DUF5684 domain-containing protein [Microbacterium sp. zg.Y1090]MDL5488048.1 DUF5684 domain-containing protein [Microbacterium sp. zg-Y1211]WIM28022.1 DUF5684 domain-containing protein [Microbacterium sp. zg-Y1090]